MKPVSAKPDALALLEGTRYLCAFHCCQCSAIACPNTHQLILMSILVRPHAGALARVGGCVAGVCLLIHTARATGSGRQAQPGNSGHPLCAAGKGARACMHMHVLAGCRGIPGGEELTWQGACQGQLGCTGYGWRCLLGHAPTRQQLLTCVQSPPCSCIQPTSVH
jgi:hypothetical protein